MEEMSFLKVEDPVVGGDILFNATGLTLWPHIWNLRQYALSTPRSCLNLKYWVTRPRVVDIAWKRRHFRNKISKSTQM